MQIILELPDDIANQLQFQSINISRRVLELIAADNYRQCRIGAAEVRRMLNLSSRWETYEFLKREQAYLPYSEEDLEEDVQAISNLLEIATHTNLCYNCSIPSTKVTYNITKKL
jgi:predicted HTH domain antitoxin